jgi:hypothetical protein
VTFDFRSIDSASMCYSVDGVQQCKPITRLAF